MGELAKRKKKADRELRKKRKKAKDPNAPKRPPTAFFLFGSHLRRVAGAEKINAATIGAKWAEMTPEQKAPFEQEAARTKQKYDDELARYRASRQAAVAPMPDYTAARGRV